MKHFLLFTLFTCTLLAHSLKVFVSEEGGSIEVYSYFTKSSPCKNCEVKLQGLDGKEFAKGVTDDFGKATFTLQKQEFKVVVDASMGHRGETEFSTQTPIKQESETAEYLKVLFAFGFITLFFGISYFFKRHKDKN